MSTPRNPAGSPESLEEMNESVVINPSAIGNPAETPRVFVGAGLRAVLRPCACGGVNGSHTSDCPAPPRCNCDPAPYGIGGPEHRAWCDSWRDSPTAKPDLGGSDA